MRNSCSGAVSRPGAASSASANRATSVRQKACTVMTCGASVVRPAARTIRSRNSDAAWRVSANTSGGTAPARMRAATASTSSVVFPVPAAPRTSTGPAASATGLVMLAIPSHATDSFPGQHVPSRTGGGDGAKRTSAYGSTARDP